MSSPGWRVLCWGDVGWDVYEDDPRPRPGGCALNVALSLAGAGAGGIACAGPIGPDGEALRELLTSRGVDAELVETLPGRTARQPIRLTNGERHLHGYQPGVLADYRPGPRVRESVVGSDWVYLPIWELTAPRAEEAWSLKPDGNVALDLMDLDGLDEAFVQEALRRSTLVFMGLNLPDQQPWIERIEAWRPAALTVITLGAQGALALHSGKRRQVPTQAGTIVDTTGCGDAFAGAFLASWIQGADLDAALDAGTRRAAVVATHRGAVG